jgi:type IV secretory pathway VirD2 relaxase
MPRRSNLSRDRVDADRIGRMGGRRPGQGGVGGALARRLGRAKVGSRPRPSAGFGRRQRVVVKAHVSRHRAGKARSSLGRHASYLGRESASADGRPGVFYDAAGGGVDARRTVAGWADDRHHFRLIVSPEHGGEIADLTAYVRETMRRVQRDLGTDLTWVAVNHHNTDNPHAHVMVRGRRPDGTDLVIPRRYVAHGIRDRASEVATELLGERSVAEVRSAKAKEVEAERFTSLDRTIERHLAGGKIDLSVDRRIGFDPDDRRLVQARLQFLARLDLARKERGSHWRVEPDFGLALRDLGGRNDVIRQLHASMGTEAGRVERAVAGHAPVSGVVVAKGSPDEAGDDRFVVVRDAAGRAHYGRVRDAEPFRDLQVGSVAELGAATHRRQAAMEQVAAVTAAHGGTYSAELHADFVRQVQPNLAAGEIASLTRSATGRLAFLAGSDGSGVRDLGGGRFAVDPVAATRLARAAGGRTDVRVVAAYPLAAQVEAHAVTWLDRQMTPAGGDDRVRQHPAVAEAIAERQQWLVAHGYADRAADGRVTLRPGVLRRLAAEERTTVADRLASRHRLPVAELAVGDVIAGAYRGTERLHGGRLAVVVTPGGVVVAPVDRTPDVATGGAVELDRRGGRRATVTPGAGRSPDRQTGAELDGLEAGR